MTDLCWIYLIQAYKFDILKKTLKTLGKNSRI